MKTELFDYDLPESAIALRPAHPRDAARLLQIRGPVLSDHVVRELPDLLVAGDVLVINETRVLPVALTGLRAARVSGGVDVRIDVNLHKLTGAKNWRAFVRPYKRLRLDDVIVFSHNMCAQVCEIYGEGEVNLLFETDERDVMAEIAECGHMPLPPYIARKRAPDTQDLVDYQTVFACHAGSVAAPTAGLHFTPRLLAALQAKSVQIEKLVLHVGAGTFLPVKDENIHAHIMHGEWRDISPELANRLNAARAQGRRIIAVGTTSLRALESAVIDGSVQAQAGETDLFITPGYKFQIIDGLITNFHLPRSTLFMLVSALAGLEMMQQAYAYAIAQDYRFYSYGDCNLIWRDGHDAVCL